MDSARRLGVRVNDLAADLRRGLRSAAALRFDQIELGIDRGQATPDALSQSGRRHLTKLVQQAGLGWAALASTSSGGGLADSARVDEQVDRARRGLRLAADMGVAVLAQDVGDLQPMDASTQGCVLDALRFLGREADRLGVVYAIRGRGSEPAALRCLIDDVAAPGLRVSVDPASLLARGVDPGAAVAALADRIALAYVRDASGGTAERMGFETALGEGALDLTAYLASLEAAGAGSGLILHRDRLVDPVRELSADAAVVRGHWG